MTTPRDLLIVALDMDPGRLVDQGDLSLALAGAELIDLLGVRAVSLDGEHIVPRDGPVPDDPLLQRAASSLVPQEPYESVDDWLWRRGRGLFSAYLAALEAEGQLSRERRSWMPFRTPSEPVLADSPALRHAADRWTAREPVLVALAAVAGVGDAPAADTPDLADDVVTVLAAVGDAELELEGARRRRAIEDAAFDNIWRGE